MQLYVKPYPFQKFADVPYSSERKRKDGSKNYGYFDLKANPNQIKKIPEIKEIPELAELIERINKQSELTTFGCDEGIDPIPNTPYVQIWTVINLHFDIMKKNESEEEYFKLIGDFLYYSSMDDERNTVIEFITSPTNYHNELNFNEGEFSHGWSLLCKVVGIGENNIEARGQWQHGMDKLTNFLT